MTEVALPGVGMTRFTSADDRPLVDLAATACWRCLDDAGLDRADVTSLHAGTALAEALGQQSGLANALAGALRIEGVAADRVENTSATGATAVHRGIEAVASGASEVALVVGADRMSAADTSAVTDAISRLTHSREYAQGLTLPSFAGLAAGAYLDRYDAPREALAAVAAKNHRNAVANEVAQFRREVSVDEALDSPVVAEPLRLYDCCPMSDGAAAIVVTRTDSVADTDHAVRVAAHASATGTHPVAERPDPLAIDSVRVAGERLFDAAGVAPGDVRSPNSLALADFDGVGLIAQVDGEAAVGDRVAFAGAFRLRNGDEERQPRLRVVEHGENEDER
ncbi:acetyl-CoA C-acetyltransferase [Halobaculum gomorrense]|uniref:Acetyl-CoA C-acetyltransferase n=2 Tax=Halobaculum gomorrense TaxID=43928 RepID=A0A1M5JIX6_9EURY|nr:acetyl-CoA C-acetyltransferase [Halobaculum gomorrense]